MGRIRGTLTAVALAAALPLTLSPAAAAAGDLDYAALGDSYASGTGTRIYYPDSGACLRGPFAYPALLALWQEVSLTFAACAGATTQDVRTEQIDALSDATDFVTLSVGGGDAGFTSVLTACFVGTEAECDRAVSAAELFVTRQLPELLDATYAEVRAAAPDAEVVVVGYPRLFELGPCPLMQFTEGERARLNEAADTLNEVISERAGAAGFDFADVRAAFDGHGVCSRMPWINGPTLPAVESFHPNQFGHAAGFLPVVAGELAGVGHSSRGS